MKKKLIEQAKVVAAVTPGTNNGVLIDRGECQEGILYLGIGAASGAPTALTVSAKIQSGENEDGSDLADVPNAVTEVLTVGGTNSQLHLDLVGYGRFVKVIPSVTFTGGTAPSIPICCTLTLGGSSTEPVV